MKKIVWLDIESTGLDCTKHGIIQIAMIMDIDGENKGELLVDVQPFDLDVVYYERNGEQQPLTYEDAIYYPKFVNEIVIKPSMVPLSRVIEFDLPVDAHKKIVAFLDNFISKFDKSDKAYLGGYNVSFDRGFISEFFRKCGDNYLGSYLNWKCLDPLYWLWKLDYEGSIFVENYKLETMAKHLGIEIYAHNAMSDIKATRELWYRLVNNEHPE